MESQKLEGSRAFVIEWQPRRPIEDPAQELAGDDGRFELQPPTGSGRVGAERAERGVSGWPRGPPGGEGPSVALRRPGFESCTPPSLRLCSRLLNYYLYYCRHSYKIMFYLFSNI